MWISFLLSDSIYFKLPFESIEQSKESTKSITENARPTRQEPSKKKEYIYKSLSKIVYNVSTSDDIKLNATG